MIRFGILSSTSLPERTYIIACIISMSVRKYLRTNKHYEWPWLTIHFGQGRSIIQSRCYRRLQLVSRTSVCHYSKISPHSVAFIVRPRDCFIFTTMMGMSVHLLTIEKVKHRNIMFKIYQIKVNFIFATVDFL